MPKPPKPPPGELQAPFVIVAAPTVVEAIGHVTAALLRKPDGGEPPAELVEAVHELTEELEEHGESIEAHARTVNDLADKVGTLSIQVHGLTEAVYALIDAVTPKPPVVAKATHVSITGGLEPLAEGGTMPPKEDFPTETLPPIVCNPIQANPTDPDNGAIFFDLTFNGPIDDEPVVFAQSGFVETTADPRVYDEVTKTTSVRIHVHPTGPEALGKFDVPCTWKADDPNTPGSTEQIHQLFKDAGEWMPPNTPKANRVTLGGGTEPLA